MYLIGDTHGLKPLFSVIDKEGLQNSSLVQVGDLGLGFQEIRRDISDLLTTDEMLEETGNTLYVIRGNHDNPIFWDKSKGLWLPKLHHIHLLDDYSFRIIDGKNVLFIGGAISIDRRPRIAEHPPSYWEDEVFKLDLTKLREVLYGIKYLDVVVTHTAPHLAYPFDANNQLVDYYHKIEMQHGVDLKEELDMERLRLTEVYDTITKELNIPVNKWVYGHFHSKNMTIVEQTKFILLNINEVIEIN